MTKIILKESEFRTLIEATVREVLDESKMSPIYYNIRDLQNKDIFTKEDMGRILDAIQLKVDKEIAYKLDGLYKLLGIRNEINRKYSKNVHEKLTPDKKLLGLMGPIAYRVRDLENKDAYTKDDLHRIINAISSVAYWLSDDERKLRELSYFFS